MAYNTLHTKGPANVDALLATTREQILRLQPFLQDQVFTSAALLKQLQLKSQVISQGGASILVPVMFGKNTNALAYAGDDTIGTTGVEGLSMAQFSWRNYAVPITLTGHEIRQNAGEKLIDLAKAKTEQSIMSLKDRINIDMFQSSQDAKKISALPILVDATSSVGDINSTTYSWWQAQVIASGSFAAQGLADLRNARDLSMQQGQSGSGAPDMLLTTRLIYELYEASQVPGIRYEDSRMANAAFESLKFGVASVFFDPNVATGEAYMLPSEALKLVVHKDANMDIGEFKEPTDQDMRVAKVIMMLNLVTTNRRRLVKLTGITA